MGHAAFQAWRGAAPQDWLATKGRWEVEKRLWDPEYPLPSYVPLPVSLYGRISAEDKAALRCGADWGRQVGCWHAWLGWVRLPGNCAGSSTPGVMPLCRPPTTPRVEHRGHDDRVFNGPQEMEGFFEPVLQGVVDLARWGAARWLLPCWGPTCCLVSWR